ncbi:hypothetical protein [Anaerovibrio slackiae]|uniref:hypothetical protein n=1 Tax=Anaerovibrio slackiae TaxID=2652309 RepID=UPI003864545C
MAQSTAPATMNEMYEQCFPCSAETAKKNLSSKSSLPMMKGCCTALRHMDSCAAQKISAQSMQSICTTNTSPNMPQKNPDQKPGFMHIVVKKSPSHHSQV